MAPLFVHEAKLSLLLRISESKLGSEKLVEKGIIESLSDCLFIKDRPEEESTMGFSFFLLSNLQMDLI